MTTAVDSVSDGVNWTLVEPRLGLGRGHYDDLLRAIVAGLGPERASIGLVATRAAVPLLDAWSQEAGSSTLELIEASSAFSEIAAIRKRSMLASERCLVATANGRHAALISALGGRRQLLSRTSLLFHWPIRGAWDRALHEIASSARSQCTALATTDSIAEDLSRVGWRRVRRVDYPVIAPPPPTPTAFRHVLMAGALRFNKGLPVLEQILHRWRQRGAEIPLLLQVSTKHVRRHGRREQPLLRRITSFAYPHLRQQSGSPDRQRYLENFHGAVTLAAYDRKTFRGQISGVALDSLLCGAPIVASHGTEPARIVEEFGSGVVADSNDPDSVETAILAIIADWESYSAMARTAAAAIARRHDPRRFVAQIQDSL